MPPKKYQQEQSETDSNSSRKYNLRKNKKDKQTSKNSARNKKIYEDDSLDLPEGVYDIAHDSGNIPNDINKETFKKNIVEIHSPSNSPPVSEDDNDDIKEEFDDSYFEPEVYVDNQVQKDFGKHIGKDIKK